MRTLDVQCPECSAWIALDGDAAHASEAALAVLVSERDELATRGDEWSRIALAAEYRVAQLTDRLDSRSRDNHEGQVEVPYHGVITFYTCGPGGYPDDWCEYDAKFTDGRLTSITLAAEHSGSGATVAGAGGAADELAGRAVGLTDAPQSSGAPIPRSAEREEIRGKIV